jgi:Carboxypeptidase regulatory-like domain/TonB dependent receptor/TonB-dependent Receptor Plug Domain
MLSRIFRYILVVFFIVRILPLSLALGQSATATLSGAVVDEKSSVVAGAKVTISSAATGLQRQITTNSEGYFTFPLLPPGAYSVRVEREGFAPVEAREIVLNVNDQRSLQIQLRVGNVNETVQVTSEAPLISESPAVSTVVDQKFVANTALNGRSFQDLILLTPGVVTQSPQSQAPRGLGSDFSVNGQRTESNYYTVDGVAANAGAGPGNGQANNNGSLGPSGALPTSTALGTTQSLVSIDALEEFRVQGSSYSAEYGRAAGGQFSFVTRSGSNELHGAAFDYLRNDVFDANDWFNNSLKKPKSALRQNDFGGTLGGPLTIPRLYQGRDRTFFFFSYEGLRLRQPQAATVQFVPSLSLRNSAPAAIQPILNAFPLPNGADLGNGFAQFIQVASAPSQIDSTSVRLDHALTASSKMFFRFSHTPSATSSRSLSNFITNSAAIQTHTFGLTSQWSTHLNNELRIGYSRSRTGLNYALDNFGGAKPVDLLQLMGSPGAPQAEAVFTLSFAGAGTSSLLILDQANLNRQWNIAEAIGLSVGDHRFKFGLDYRRISAPLKPFDPLASATFRSRNTVLLNTPDSASIFRSVVATPIFNEFSAYAQDEWRVGRRLNLSLGLRWDVNPPPKEANGNDAFTLQGDIGSPSTLTLAPRGAPLWKTTWRNFAPRFGASAVLRDKPTYETVARGGVGFFFDSGNHLGASGFSGLGFVASQTYAGASLPFTAAQFNFSPSTTPPFTSSTVYAFASNLKMPYTVQWNASLAQGVGRGQVVTITYVGASGRRLLQQRQLLLRPLNPNFNNVRFIRNGSPSNYQALQMQFQRRLTQGVQALASYTWSHSIDYGSADVALAFQRGNSDFDLRHNFAATVSWDLPSKVNGEFAKAVLANWGLDARFSARTGFPVNIQGALLTDPSNGDQRFGGVNIVSGAPTYLTGDQYPGHRRINLAAFTAISVFGQTGNAPRNALRGFGAHQVNLALRRDFHVGEKLTVQFRVEAFNVFNHPNFGVINTTLTNSAFGQATQMLSQSLSTMSALYQQGGARSMQFALKLRF